MTLRLWFAFAVMEFFLALSPGPAVLFVSSQGIRYGTRASSLGALGISSANLTYFFISALGVSTLLVHAGILLEIIKTAGAFYLMYLGVTALQQSHKTAINEAITNKGQSLSSRSAYSQAYITQISNPKAIIFFSSIVPQFLRPEGDVSLQIGILAATTTIIETTVLMTYGWLGAHGGKSLKNNPVSARWIERISGIILVVIGINLLFLQ